jgi:hypothetical protein
MLQNTLQMQNTNALLRNIKCQEEIDGHSILFLKGNLPFCIK